MSEITRENIITILEHAERRVLEDTVTLLTRDVINICRLALAAMPVVGTTPSWTQLHSLGWMVTVGPTLHVGIARDYVWWLSDSNGTAVTKGTADSLEAAKAAAEEALLGLMRGEAS